MVIMVSALSDHQGLTFKQGSYLFQKQFPGLFQNSD